MNGGPLGRTAVEALYRETEGNALHVVEAVRAGTPGGLPVSVQVVIAARLAQLSAPARALAGLAATIGRDFTFPVLARAARQSDEEVVVGLDELIQRRLVREHGDVGYDFSHDKIRMVAYAGLSAARRRLLHGRVAEVAGRLYAHTDAILHLERALALLGSPASSPIEAAWHARTLALLQETLGDIRSLLSQHQAAITAYQAAKSVASRDRCGLAGALAAQGGQGL